MSDAEQLSLFDALERVQAGTDPDWEAAAEIALTTLVKRGKPFTSRDVWGLIPVGVTTRENKAMGPVIRRAIAAGLIRRSGQTRRSGSHKRDQTIWEVIVTCDSCGIDAELQRVTFPEDGMTFDLCARCREVKQ